MAIGMPVKKLLLALKRSVCLKKLPVRAFDGGDCRVENHVLQAPMLYLSNSSEDWTILLLSEPSLAVLVS